MYRVDCLKEHLLMECNLPLREDPHVCSEVGNCNCPDKKHSVIALVSYTYSMTMEGCSSTECFRHHVMRRF